MKRKLINVFITLVVGLIYFYFAIPAINLTNPSFYVFVAFLLLVYGALNAGSSAVEILHKGKREVRVQHGYADSMYVFINCNRESFRDSTFRFEGIRQ